jgi:hypothetical protein
VILLRYYDMSLKPVYVLKTVQVLNSIFFLNLYRADLCQPD